MRRDLVKVSEDTGLTEVAQRMTAGNTRRVVVVDQNDEIVGIVREQELFFEISNIIL